MKLSTKGKYGVYAMLDLAINYGKEPISIKSISNRTKVTEYYLEQLFSPLRKANLIKSVRGAQGGYTLKRDPSEITIYDIMEVLEGPVELSECIDEDKSCKNSDCCATRLLWKRIKDSMDSILKNTTLADMVEDYNNMQKEKNEKTLKIDLNGGKENE